ncbi:MAG: hypothetical protein R3Y56_09860 [Akkermansia sp.]
MKERVQYTVQAKKYSLEGESIVRLLLDTAYIHFICECRHLRGRFIKHDFHMCPLSAVLDSGYALLRKADAELVKLHTQEQFPYVQGMSPEQEAAMKDSFISKQQAEKVEWQRLCRIAKTHEAADQSYTVNARRFGAKSGEIHQLEVYLGFADRVTAHYPDDLETRLLPIDNLVSQGEYLLISPADVALVQAHTGHEHPCEERMTADELEAYRHLYELPLFNMLRIRDAYNSTLGNM